MKRKKGQILVITLLVLTILSILTVTLVMLSNKDVSQTVNSEVYEKIYNSSETKLKEVLNNVAAPSIDLSTLQTKYPTNCINLGGSILTYECNFTLPSGTSGVSYNDKIVISNEKNIEDYNLPKDRPLTVSLQGYSSTLKITTNKASALEFTLIYLQGSTYKTFSGVYDPTSGIYNSTDNNFINYITPDPLNNLGFTLNFPASYQSFQLLSITPRLKTGGDSILISVKATDLSTYPVQIRKFLSESYSNKQTDSPLAKIITQIPLVPQLDGLLDYSLLTSDTVKVNN